MPGRFGNARSRPEVRCKEARIGAVREWRVDYRAVLTLADGRRGPSAVDVMRMITPERLAA